jgi:hypothetical protein
METRSFYSARETNPIKSEPRVSPPMGNGPFTHTSVSNGILEKGKKRCTCFTQSGKFWDDFNQGGGNRLIDENTTSQLPHTDIRGTARGAV